MADKPLLWLGVSRTDVSRRSSPRWLSVAPRSAGPRPERLETNVGRRRWVREIRIRVGDAFRVFYVATFDEGVYVIHAFAKKARKTARRDIEICRERFRALIATRKQQHGKERPR